MKGNWLHAVLALTLASSLAGCSSSTSDAASASASSSSSAASSGKDSVTVAAGGQFTTLDPAMNTEVVNSYVLDHIYAGLFRKDSSGTPQPELAESYEVSEDGLTYTIHLKDGITWSDGTEITAQDFVYSYLRALSYGADNAWSIYSMTQFIAGASEYNQKALAAGETFDCTKEDHSEVGIEAPDEKTLVLTLRIPCTYLTALLTSGGAFTAVSESTPQHDSLWSMSPGYATSGPYTLKEFNENDKAVLEKNDAYCKASAITMPNLIFQVMPDQDAQSVAFQTGEIDIASSVTHDTAESYEGTDQLWVIDSPSNYFLAINSGETGPEWAKNVNVRKALAEAIDKKSLADVLGGESFYPPMYGYVPKGFAGNDGDYREEGDQAAEDAGTMISYDPVEAKTLLAAAGYDESHPLHITYKYSNSGIGADVATVLQQMWEAIGVEVDFEAVESGVYYDQLDAGNFEIARYGLNASNSPIEFLDIWTSGMQITPAVDDPAYDAMVENAKEITDPEEFLKACHEAESYLYYENVYVIPLFQNIYSYLVQEGLHGYEVDGGSTFYGYCHYN